jgi:hypothetical protein
VYLLGSKPFTGVVLRGSAFLVRMSYSYTVRGEMREEYDTKIRSVSHIWFMPTQAKSLSRDGRVDERVLARPLCLVPVLDGARFVKLDDPNGAKSVFSSVDDEMVLTRKAALERALYRRNPTRWRRWHR